MDGVGTGAWPSPGVPGLARVNAELDAAEAALQEAVDGLRRADALTWQSTAADIYRARAEGLLGRVLHSRSQFRDARGLLDRGAAQG